MRSDALHTDAPPAGLDVGHGMKRDPLAAVAPLIIIAVIFGLHLKVVSPRFTYDPPLLVLALNVVFLSLVSFFLARISAKSYLLGGNPILLFLGCGALAVGLAGLAAGWSTGVREGTSVSTALQNSGFFLGGIFHFAGAVSAFMKREEPSGARRKTKLLAAYTGVLALMLLSFFLNRKVALPVPDYAASTHHQLLLASAIVLFAVSSLFFLAASLRLHAAFLYWYALGLALISSGLLAFLLVSAEGSPIAWAGRLAQYAGGIYLLMAVSKARMAARSRNVSLERLVSGLFRKPRALYESLVGATTDAIISLDRNGRVLLWNPAAVEMFGYRSDEVQGLKIVDLIIPEDGGGSISDVVRVPSAAENRRVEAEARRRSGERFQVEVSMSKTRSGGEWVTTLIVRDIDDRKRTELDMRQAMEALALERGLLNAVLEQMPAGVIIAEAERGDPILGNRIAENLWLEGFRAERALHADGKPYLPEEWPLTRAMRNGEVILQEEVAFLRTDGTKGILSVNAAPIRDEGEKAIAGVLTFHDITPRKAMEDELRKSRRELELRVRQRTAELERKNQDLRDFTFIASHDLQEPLRKIQTFGDLIVARLEGFPDEPTRDYVRRMQRGAARMELLLNSLLNYSRLNSRAQCFSPTDLNEAVREAVSALEIRIRETGGSVEVQRLPTLLADGSQITQIFQNLIGNALKFHKDGERPVVKISSQPLEGIRAGGHKIFVEDNGIGFDEQYLERIFMPFQRLHGRSEYSGVGMGLAICKKIVERHGGHITAKSAPGKGSTFIVTLPTGGCDEQNDTVPGNGLGLFATLGYGSPLTPLETHGKSAS